MVTVAGASATDRAAALASEFATRAAAHDREASFPFENFAALHAAGLLGLTVPREFGGGGAGIAESCRVVGEIARGDASTALVFAMQLIQFATTGRRNRWPAAVWERVCREAVRDGALVNAARVEPELGTPARGGLPATTATRTEHGWRIDGRKIYTTGSPLLRYFFVWARTAGDEPRVGMFLVPRDAPGLSIEETWDHLGMRATGSHDLVLSSALIPAENAVDVRLPAEWTPDPRSAAWNTLVIAALYDGVARAARDWLAQYLNERTPSNLGAPLATLPRFQTAVGEIDALLLANRRLVYGLAEQVDADGSGAAETSTVKYLATTNAIRAVDIALALIGNPGLSRHNPLERHHRDVLCSRIHSPQDDMVLLGLGKAALGR
jgi:alkylation response protein AidB-like acyl-CoA dehydrogenase